MTKQISIVGAGVAGLVLGQLLRRRQVPAIIWEKSKHYPNLQNFGITLHANTYLPLLQELQIDQETFFRETVIQAGDGKQQAVRGGTIRVNRSKLLALLAKDLDIRWSHKLISLSKGSQARHQLSFRNEHDKEVTHESDKVVAADGVHSAVRNKLGSTESEFKLEVLPFVVYNGKRTYSIEQLPEGLQACLQDPAGLSLERNGSLLKITSGYQNDQEAAFNYTLSRPAGPHDEDLLHRQKTDAEKLAQRFVNEAAELGELPEPFKSIFDPTAMGRDRLLHWLMRSAALDVKPFMTHAEQGIYVFGDAANPTPILGGEGANNAMLSALQLVQLLDQGESEHSGTLRDMHTSWLDWKQQSEQALRAMHAQAAVKSAI